MLDNLPSKYTPLCKYDATVQGGTFKADLGTVAAEAKIVDLTVTATVAGSQDYGATPVVLDAKYGRNIQVVASASDTAKVTVKGYDYLDQPVTEELTLNGTTAVLGVKAFKKICNIDVPAGTAATVTVKTGSKFGLPVRCTQVLATIESGVKGTVGTLVAPVNTAQTATSADPRGTLSFSSYNGKHLVVIGVADDSTFTISGKECGGLHGIPHYFA